MGQSVESVKSARGETLDFRVLSVAFPFEEDANVPTQEVLKSSFFHSRLICQLKPFGCSELTRQLMEDGELLCSQ